MKPNHLARKQDAFSFFLAELIVIGVTVMWFVMAGVVIAVVWPYRLMRGRRFTVPVYPSVRPANDQPTMLGKRPFMRGREPEILARFVED